MEDYNYPNDDELNYIEKFGWTGQVPNYHKLFDYITPQWEVYGTIKKTGNKYYLATGGWSGNEDIIGALKKNHIFWGTCWQMSQRGGAYTFKVPRAFGG